MKLSADKPAADLNERHLAQKTSNSALGQPAVNFGRSKGGGLTEEALVPDCVTG